MTQGNYQISLSLNVEIIQITKMIQVHKKNPTNWQGLQFINK